MGSGFETLMKTAEVKCVCLCVYLHVYGHVLKLFHMAPESAG